MGNSIWSTQQPTIPSAPRCGEATPTTAPEESTSSRKRKNDNEASNDSTATASLPSSSKPVTIVDLTEEESENEAIASTASNNGIKRQKTDSEEIRLLPWVKHAPGNILQRLDRAMTQRMYLIKQQDTSTENNLCKTYSVLGSTGNVYNVKIEKFPSCTCPDTALCCKHILFVLLRVLKVPKKCPLIYQNALLQHELRFLFEGSPNPGNHIFAKEAVINAFIRASVTESEDAAASIRYADMEAGAECPICFEELKKSTDNNEETKEETIMSCVTCSKYIHTDCISLWKKSSPKPTTCPLCRQLWSDGALGKEENGYLNFADMQNIPRHSSTFRHHYRRRWN